jgi:hypothetical protein
MDQFVLLVRLLQEESTAISPSLKSLNLEPAQINSMEVKVSANWGVAFSDLETVLQNKSPLLKLTQTLCSTCQGLLPSQPYTMDPGESEKNCFFCHDSLPRVCRNCQTMRDIAACPFSSTASSSRISSGCGMNCDIATCPLFSSSSASRCGMNCVRCEKCADQAHCKFCGEAASFCNFYGTEPREPPDRFAFPRLNI